MRSLALATAILFAASSAGCAMISASAPDPQRAVDEPPRCNPSKGAVAVDGIIASSLGVGAIAVAGESGGAAAVLGLGALIYGVSAGVGNSSANKCRAASDEFLAYRREELERARRGATVGGLPTVPTDEEDEAAVAAPPPRVAPPVAATSGPASATPPAVTATPPRPVAATRPPPATPRAPANDDDDEDAGDPGDDADDSVWSAFWKEVP